MNIFKITLNAVISSTFINFIIVSSLFNFLKIEFSKLRMNFDDKNYTNINVVKFLYEKKFNSNKRFFLIFIFF